MSSRHDTAGAARAPTAGLDLGGTKLRGVLLDGDGEVRADATVPTGGDDGPDAICARAAALVERLEDEAGARAAAAGVGFAGLVDVDRGVVRSSVILPGWDGFPVVERLVARLGRPVCLENDATAAGVGEVDAWTRRRPGAPPDLALVTVGTGIGAALFPGGRLHRGASGLAGELGHVGVDPDGETCVCGRRGCLHTTASGTALTARAARLAEEHPDWTPAGPGRAPDLASVGRAAAAGDARARAFVEEGGRALGAGLADLVQLFAPSRIALCGGVTRLGEPWLAAVRDEVRRLVFAESWEGLDLGLALHGGASGAVGAACLARAFVADGAPAT